MLPRRTFLVKLGFHTNGKKAYANRGKHTGMKIPALSQDAASGPDGVSSAHIPPNRHESHPSTGERVGRAPDGRPEEAEKHHSAPPEPDQPTPEGNQDHWRRWLASPAGRYVLDWEQQHLDEAVANLFGFVAIQCGLRELSALRQNRMRSRFIVSRSDNAAHYGDNVQAADVVIESYEELPVATESVDLIVLPHVLEFAADPHQVLREVDRVLRPDGRAIIVGFNPVSLWGIGQTIGRLRSRPPLPPDEHFIGLPRLKDWCKLLSFEIQAGSYGCYRPLVASDNWLARTEFLEKAGDRWWPICGAVYSVTVVKRVRGMRVVGPRWKHPVRARPAVGVASPTYTPPPIGPSAIPDYDSKFRFTEQGITNSWQNPSRYLPTAPVKATPDQADGER